MSNDLIGLDPEWKSRAACRAADVSLFVTADDEPEPPYPSPEAAAYCRRCPVMPECLAEALKFGHLGVWGNTTDYGRRQLRRRRDRVYCPVCGSRELTAVPKGDAQVCVSCGVSWSVRHPAGRRVNTRVGHPSAHPPKPPASDTRAP